MWLCIQTQALNLPSMLLWRVVFVLVAVCAMTVVLPKLNSQMVSDRMKKDVILPNLLRRQDMARRNDAARLQAIVLPADISQTVVKQLRRLLPEKFVTTRDMNEDTLFTRSDRFVYVTETGEVQKQRRGVSVAVKWKMNRTAAASPYEGYPIKGITDEGVVELDGFAFENPRIGVTRLMWRSSVAANDRQTDESNGGESQAVVVLGPGPSSQRYTRPSDSQYFEATMELILKFFGNEARVLLLCSDDTVDTATLQSARMWAKMYCKNAVRAVASKEAAISIDRSGQVTIDGRTYEEIDTESQIVGSLKVDSFSKSTVTFDDGQQMTNPIKVARMLLEQEDVDVAVVIGKFDAAEVPQQVAVVQIHTDGTFDSAKTTQSGTVVWSYDTALPHVNMDELTDAEVLILKELYASALKATGSGLFRLLNPQNRTMATCNLRPGRMADVRLFNESRQLQTLFPSSLPPDCTNESDVSTTVEVTSALTSRVDRTIGVVAGLRSLLIHGSDEAKVSLQCPRSGRHTIEIFPQFDSDLRTVLHVPRLCDVSPCLTSEDV